MKTNTLSEIRMSSTFEHLYKKKKGNAPEYILVKAVEAINDLISTSNPESLGEKKKGQLGDYYSIDLTRGHRILYRVTRESENIIINLDRICDHKEVYGKD